MSMMSYFVFNKIKNHLKKNNIELKEFVFFDKEKLLLNIDNKEIKIEGELKEKILNEIYLQNMDDVLQFLITKNKIVLLSKSGGKLEL